MKNGTKDSFFFNVYIIIPPFSVLDGTEWTQAKWCTLPEGHREYIWWGKYQGYLKIYLMFVTGFLPFMLLWRKKFFFCKRRYNHSTSSPALKRDFRYIIVFMLVFFGYTDLFHRHNYSGELKSFKEEKPVLLQYCEVFCWRSKQLPLLIPKTN